LTVSSALAFSPVVFSYGDFNEMSMVNTITLNPNTHEYLLDSNENAYMGIILRNNFETYLSEWKKNTQFYSFSNQIIQDVNFQRIVSMGELAVPLILNEIKNEPSTLIWALNIIYKKKISDKPNMTIEEACKLWVKSLS